MITPEFYAQLRHNQHRRADFHDYLAPCFYLITFLKNPSPEVPLFSAISNRDGEVAVDFSWSGWAVYNGIRSFAKDFPFIRIWRYVIMPDHVHVVLQVTRRLDEHLGRYMGSLKIDCSQAFHKKALIRNHSEEPVFDRGFNDRILFSKDRDQLDNWLRYVADNPRRLLLMRSRPDFFSKAVVAGRDELPAELWIAPSEPMVQLYGNRLLLEYPELCVVRFSRRFTAEEWEQKKREALLTARNGGVLISPFIHKEEKGVMDEGLLLGGKVIKVIADGYSERGKPQGADFRHCSEGRMLLAAMNAGGGRPTPVSRDLCLRMNMLAAWIAANAGRLLR